MEHVSKPPAEPQNKPVTLGEASFALRYKTGGSYVDLGIEEGVESIFAGTNQTHATYVDLNGERKEVMGPVLDVFNAVVMDIASDLTTDCDYPSAFGLTKILVVTHRTFIDIRKSSPPPEWAGVYVWWDGTVVYDAAYIAKSLSCPNDDWSVTINLQYFYEEMRHEMLHSYESAVFFDGDEEIVKHFSSNSLWFIEGLKEAIGRNLSALPLQEFTERLHLIRQTYPEFSIATLDTDFWKYDASPTNTNISYQYCRLFMKFLAPYITEAVKTKEKKHVDVFYKPFEASYALLQSAVKRYKEGNRESIVDVLHEEYGITRSTTKLLEQKFLEEFDKPTA